MISRIIKVEASLFDHKNRIQLLFYYTLFYGKYTVQVRDKRPTHAQNARTNFTQMHVKKRVRIWAHFLLLFTLIYGILLLLLSTEGSSYKHQ